MTDSKDHATGASRADQLDSLNFTSDAGAYDVRTLTSRYRVELDLDGPCWVTRHTAGGPLDPRCAPRADLRKDTLPIRVVEIEARVGLPMAIALTGLTPGATTLRLTTPVVSITKVPDPTEPVAEPDPEGPPAHDPRSGAQAE